VQYLAALCLVVLFGTISASTASPPETLYWMRLSAKTAAERTAIANHISIESVNADDVVALGSSADLARMQKDGRVISYYEVPQSTLDFPKSDERFHNFDELTKALKELAQNYSQWATLTSIGKTIENRDIWMLTLGEESNNPAVPAILFVGGHHAREHISIETPFLIAQELLVKRAGGDAQISQLLKTRTVHIIPMLNVDGAEYDIASNSYRMWRKNRATNRDGSSGVDLNRNYDYKFGTVGASNDPRSEVYHGPKGFSEPETQAIRDFLIAHTNVTIVQSYHTYSELILYPWGYTNSPISNPVEFRVHKQMAEDMSAWNGYTVQQSSELYLTSGDTCDWAYGALGLICFTFELDPKSQWDGGFYPGQQAIDIVFQKNWLPALYLIDHADSPYRALEPASTRYGVSSLGW
jgi:carboxypeptidase T